MFLLMMVKKKYMVKSTSFVADVFGEMVVADRIMVLIKIYFMSVIIIIGLVIDFKCLR